MKLNDRQLGRPQILYKGTKTHIESLPNPEEGMIAYATDTDELGSFDGNSWNWGSGGGGSSTFIDLSDTPSSYTGHSYKLLRVNQGETGIEFITPASGEVTSFISLADTPSSYTGQAGKVPTVNQAETGLEFISISGGGGVTSFIGLSDTPSSYTGQSGKVPVVNDNENGLAFVNISGISSGFLDIWLPESAPISPHSLNDEFNDNTLDSSWYIFDPNSHLSVVESDVGLELIISNDTAEEILGVYKPMPSATEFSVWTKPGEITPFDKGLKSGIFFSPDYPITTSSEMFILAYSTEGIRLYTQVEKLFNYQNFDYGLLNDEKPMLFFSSYMRLRMQINSSDMFVWLDSSMDAVSWTNVSYRLNSGSQDYFTCPFVPQSIGLFIKKHSWDNITCKAIFPFFRAYENIDLHYIPKGRRV